MKSKIITGKAMKGGGSRSSQVMKNEGGHAVNKIPAGHFPSRQKVSLKGGKKK